VPAPSTPGSYPLSLHDALPILLCTALAHGAQAVHVTEHVRERNVGIDDLQDTAAFSAVDLTAPGIQVADDVAHVILGRDNFNLRSEEHTSELHSRENLVCRLLL